jgi:kinesin family protein 2/24
MDKFYLNNAAQYQTLVKALSPTPVPQLAKVVAGTTSASMVVGARIRPLLNNDIDAGFPCAMFPRSAQTSVVDIHDLYNHPRGRPILKVRRQYSHLRLFVYRSITLIARSPSTMR